MSIVRVSPEALQKKRDRLSAIKEEIRVAEEIVRERDCPLWRRLAPGLKASIQANQEKLDEITDAPSVSAAEERVNIATLRGAIVAYKNILEMVENEGNTEVKRKKAADLAAEIEQIRTEQQL